MEAEVTSRLIEMAAKVKSAKMELLRNVLKEIPNEQALIFCLRKITARELKEILEPRVWKSRCLLRRYGTDTKRPKLLKASKTAKPNISCCNRRCSRRLEPAELLYHV